jgi:hypothetical protein
MHDKSGLAITVCGGSKFSFSNSSRINDEFERIRVLILFHQLQIDEPLS